MQDFRSPSPLGDFSAQPGESVHEALDAELLPPGPHLEEGGEHGPAQVAARVDPPAAVAHGRAEDGQLPVGAERALGGGKGRW